MSEDERQQAAETDEGSGGDTEAGASPSEASEGEGPRAPGFGAVGDGKARPSAPRSARQVRSAARILHKEATRILKKHGRRIAAEPARRIRECLAAIDAQREAEDWRGLQTTAEQLDELLEQHASFARKSALRETIENIGIAVLIALGLRSCLYEPFKIPSGSMMPTLRNGDHIFVNKFVYGVQIPFTTTVIGESLGEIERGDVIVFRFPLDESQDFIKRVIGLPGDEVQVMGRQVAIKRAGESEFEVLPRRRLEDRCYDDDNKRPVANCTLYEETLGDHTYVVRYRLTTEERGELAAPPQVWKVPEGHLLVMGDNRNDSLDSLRWTETVEAVEADGLLSTKDLRDLTDERLFSMSRPAYVDEQADYWHDHVIFKASHRALDHDLALEVWREPTLGAQVMAEAKVATLEGARAMGWDALVGPGEGAELDRLRRHGEGIAALWVAEDPDTRTVVLRRSEPADVLALSCGRALCPDEATLAERMGEVLDRFEANHGREARELLVRPAGGDANYSSQFESRHSPRDHYYERVLSAAGGEEAAGERGRVRLRAFRRPQDGTELVQDAALRAFGLAPEGEPGRPEPQTDERGLSSWTLETEQAWVSVGSDTARDMVVVLECGKATCNDAARLEELAAVVHERVPKAASDRRRLKDLLTSTDLEGMPEVPAKRPELAEYDRVRLEATVKGDSHRVELEAWLHPEGGMAAKLKALRDEVGGLEPDDAVLPGAYGKAEADAVVFVFPVEESETVIRLRCHQGLCPSRETAVALVRRAASRAKDPSNFIDPEAERPKPFVPRGNVKGRADRIWLPLSRFWLPIR
ncbi:MAG: signal peptidase I [Myxococcales bacterium]|nr:signal peptidase I [Myxococcales bacterium]